MTVLDASAVLAYLFREPGWQRAFGYMSAGAEVSAVNWSEVRQWLSTRGLDPDRALDDVVAAGTSVTPFTLTQASVAADLYPAGKPLGLSLADRACLAAALDNGPAVTCDRSWGEQVGPVAVVQLRGQPG